MTVTNQILDRTFPDRSTPMTEALIHLSRVAAGPPGTAITYADAEATGRALAALVIPPQPDTQHDEPVVMKSKYTPVHLKKRPVPVSVPLLKREPYRNIPLPEAPQIPTHPPPIKEFAYTEKLSAPRVQTILDNMDRKFLSCEEQDLLFWVLTQNEEAIAFEDSDCGRFKKKYFPDYIMETVPHTPWQLSPIRIHDAIKEEVTHMLKEQLNSGNVSYSTSSYRSRMFVVIKPKGGLRSVWDLRNLNKISIQDAMLPPNVSEFADAFVGYSIYGTLDLYSGYHHRTLHPDSRPLTACQTLIGNVQLNTLPMGYTNSMQEFQRSTSHIIESLIPEKALAFVDDIGVKGPRSTYNNETIPENREIRRFVWEYAHTLYTVLKLLATAGATASGKKLVLGVREVEIVGTLCNLEGTRPTHGTITKVLNWPVPTSVTEVRGFLGTVGVARSWIRDHAKIAKPLTELTKLEPKQFYWPKSAQDAFDTLKKKVAGVVALKKVDMVLAKHAGETFEPGKLNEGRLVLAVDSSIIAIGFVLYQVLRSDDKELAPHTETNRTKIRPETKQRKRGELKKFPVRFGSITLNKSESNYSQPKVELYGVFRALKALEYLIWGTEIRIETDSASLKAMLESPGHPSVPMARWVSYIWIYNLEVIHIKAEQHVAPDGLSRRRQANEDTDNTDIEYEDERSSGTYIRAKAKTKALSIGPFPAPLMTSIADEQDDAPARVKDYGTHNTNTTASEREEACRRTICAAAGASYIKTTGEEKETEVDNYQDAQLQNISKFLQTRKVPNGVKNQKSFKQSAKRFFILENAMWQQSRDGAKKVIINQHRRDTIIREAHDESGHRGRDPTYRKIADSYYWPKLMNQVATYVRTCKRCQLRSTYYPKIRINPTWVPTVLRKFNMDLVDMGIRSNGYQYIADIRDDLSGWLEARMLTRKTSDDVADFLWQDIICRFGCIPQISTDNGTEFKKAVDVLTKKYGTNLVRISPHNPAANGMIERGHRTWINSIWKLCGSRKHKWSKWVYPALWADRVTTRRATGYSPYYLLYGKPHLFPFNVQDKIWFTVNWHNVDSTEDLLAIRALQIHKMHVNRSHAVTTNRNQRVAAAEHHAIRNARRLISGIYRPGEFVIVALKGPGIVRGQNMPKSNDTWAGPFKIVRRFKSGSYEVSELDGARIKGSIPAAHLKPFYTRQAQVVNREIIASDGSSDGEHQFYPSSAEDDKRASDYEPEMTSQQK
jgi:hypothetical protein